MSSILNFSSRSLEYTYSPTQASQKQTKEVIDQTIEGKKQIQPGDFDSGIANFSLNSWEIQCSDNRLIFKHLQQDIEGSINIPLLDNSADNNVDLPENHDQFLSLVLYLFNGNKIDNTLALLLQKQQVNEHGYDNLIRFLTQIKQRLFYYQLTRKRMLGNQNNYNIRLLIRINNTINHLENMKLLCRADENALVDLFKNLVIGIKAQKQAFESKVSLDPQSAIIKNGTLPLTALKITADYNDPASNQIASSKSMPHSGLGTSADATITSDVVKIGAGILWAMADESKRGLKLETLQQLGFEKTYILTLVNKLLKKGYKLTSPHKAVIREILGIKRSSYLIPSLGKTESLRVFDEITSEEKTDLNNSKTINTQADINAKVAELLKDLAKTNEPADCSNLINYLEDLKSDNEETLLRPMHFEKNGVRLNLYYYLKCLAAEGKITNKTDYDKLIEQAEKIFINSPSAVNVSDADYLTIYNNLREYLVKDKHSVIEEIQGICLAIYKHKDLSKQQKECLLSYIKDELAKGSSGQFAKTREKRLFHHKYLVGPITSQGANFNKDLAALSQHSNPTLSVQLFSSGAGSVCQSTLFPISEHLSIGNTTTYNSLQEIVTTTIDLVSEINETNETAGPDVIISQMKKELFAALEDKTKSKEVLTLLEKLQQSDKLLVYLILSGNQNGQLLVDRIFCFLYNLNEINEFSTVEESKEVRKHLPKFLQLWNEAVVTYTNYDQSKKAQELTRQDNLEAENENSAYPLNKSGLQDKDASNLKPKFNIKEYIGSQSFNTAQEALLGFYRTISLILKNSYEQEEFGNSNYSDDEKSRLKQQKLYDNLEYFSHIILRAQNDSSSNWHVLRLRTREEIQKISFITRIAIVAATSVCSFFIAKLITLYFVVKLLLTKLNLIKGISLSILNSEALTHTDTLEYKSAQQVSSLLKSNLAKTILKANSESENRQPESASQADKDKENLLKSRLEYIFQRDLKAQETMVYKGLSNQAAKLGGREEQSIDPNSKYKVLEEDKKSLDQINKLKAKEPTEIYVKVNEIFTNLQDEAADNYLATKAWYRFIAIIKSSELDNKHKIEILTKVGFAFNYRTLKISQIISKERNLISQKRNFFLELLSCGSSFTSFFLDGLIAGLEGLNQTLANSSQEIPITGAILLLSATDEYANTKSFQICMKHLKNAISDCMNAPLPGDLTTKNANHENAVKLLKTHTARIGFGNTDSYENYLRKTSKIKC